MKKMPSKKRPMKKGGGKSLKRKNKPNRNFPVGGRQL